MSDLNKSLAKEIAKGLIYTGIEGGYDSVAKSTAYAYPSIGVSQWEGNRANELLRAISAAQNLRTAPILILRQAANCQC